MHDLKVTLIQDNLQWQDPEANRNAFQKHIQSVGKTDVIILPEMFTTGFSMASDKLAETMDGPSVQWMIAQAKAADAAVTGSLIIKENDQYYNRMVWAQPDGTVQHYDKRHLFRMADEDANFSNGNTRTIIDWRGWQIMLQVCYDLRFPVFSRNRAADRYDLCIYVANWPEARRDPWKKLLYARAIENQAYVVGANRIGEDANGISYSGDSMVIDPKGDVIGDLPAHKTCFETVTLNRAALETFRSKFPVGMDADDFELR